MSVQTSWGDKLQGFEISFSAPELARQRIGDTIQQARLKAALTQAEFIDRHSLGISPSYLSQIEKGRAVPLSILERISSALGFTLSEFFASAQPFEGADATLDLLSKVYQLVEASQAANAPTSS